MNFMERAVSGEISDSDLDNELEKEITAWHNYSPTIPEEVVGENVMTWLGMAWHEYARWVEDPHSLKDIIEKRKLKL